MEQRISLREANQHLARFVKSVEGGDAFVITRRGRPVARLVPVEQERELSAEQKKALARTEARMARGYDLGGIISSRDELHER
ncbi:MAG: type II toxin-antitoxin system prevent-host-death family antitoxin [Magnetococcales bacterium]|nr:type II toxin-antitoxin system prevent-host-death family antitoxin [Magnetococcales bacterium]